MSGAFIPLARNEFRALLPVWAATAATMVADPLVRGTGMHGLFPLGMFAYIMGSLALGAHIIGHEYTNRTLGTLLAQPCSRSAILMAKTAVLAVTLLSVMLLAWPLLLAANVRMFAGVPRYPMLLLPFAGGLFVAPYLTMRLRSQMAGVVFTAAIPGTTYLLLLLSGIAIYGIGSRAPDALARAMWPPAMLIFAAAGAVLSARSFLRLQDIEGGREELQLPSWLAATDRNPIRPPLWALAKKELRLQQMTFAMAALFAGIWTALTIAGRLDLEFARDVPIQGVGLLYFALLPLLIGSLASAQEHQFGTFESQAMLPISFARQWTVKAGVVLVLAMLLGVVLPWLVFAPPQLSRQSLWPLAVAIVLLTSWSLYLSSWTRSGIIALALVLPSTVAALWAAQWIDGIVSAALKPGHFLVLTRPADLLVFTTIIAAPFVAALLSFASRNHRTRERSAKILAVQTACLAGVFLVADALSTVL